ncbi:MAG: valine--tRNA ligase [Candidatus Omnitrophica bacterium]|nr:valine--tRNA ligase [Candidatus Omnitrophota bacterium]
MEELAKKYNFKDIEEKQYLHCEKNDLFHGKINSTKKPFSIVIPPPNVTGILHMGHALNNTVQDILIRYKKMAGFETLWMPGTDHAGIATQNVVERKLAKEKLTRDDVGREKFLEHVWDWKQEYGSTIIKQLRSLACACDWQRTRFTMDEGYSDAVLEVFIRLYDKGLIYRGNRIINWCPRCQTALSDEEAPHQDMDGHLYHIKYPIKDSAEFLVVATTRPETMLGDTAVAVHPNDKRYKDLIGKIVILPLIQREIKIIADDFVDPAFGTGAVKVTPAHDPNDYGMGKRHNLEFINILHPDGVCNANAGKYNGLDRFAARKAVIEDLKQQGLLVKIDSHAHAVGHCYRCDTVIEPYYSKQWFVSMKPLAIPATEAVRTGEIKFHPERWTKVYLNWMDNIQDWCISRQIWWGHRIPVYYCAACQDEDDYKKGVIVSRIKPDKCRHCGATDLVQDPDVLDTWFSSWLWPFATFGWPFNQKAEDGKQKIEDEKQKIAKQELDYFYPTDVLVTAPEIIFFWVARMIMAGFEFIGDIPFKDVYLHGTVRDDTGKKMSKSLGNSIDPLEIIAEYGTDALRFSLISITSMGQDVYLSKEKFEFGRNFCNKIWNASRFILMNFDGVDVSKEKLPLKNDLNLADAWILSRFNLTLKKLNQSLSKYRLNEAVNIIYEFFWHQLCDWYIELSKLNIENKDTKIVLYNVLEMSLRLMHPFMPLISDEIWQKVTGNDTAIMSQPWPEINEDYIDLDIEKEMQLVMDNCVSIRNLRSENNIKPKDKVDIELYPEDKSVLNILEKNLNYLLNMSKVENLHFADKSSFKVSVNPSSTAAGCVIVMKLKLDETFDPEKETQKIEAQIKELNQHIIRKDKLLSNENYVKKAPVAIVEKEKQSLLELKQEIDKLEKIKSALK